MANIPTVSYGVYNAQARREYITTSAFNTDFYTYTTSMSPTTFETRGTLAANVSGATATTCPANRILRENGKKLYPDANPQISTYMVGVYDANSGLTGYIDPNSPKFSVYNSDKPVYLSDGVNPNGGLTDQGQPVYTRGTVMAGSISSLGTFAAVTTITAGTGGFIMPVNPTVAATGTTNANAASITGYGLTLVSGADDAVGVILPTAVPGGIIYIKSTVAAKVLKIYPAAGAQINALTVTTGNYNTAAAGVTILVASSATQWYTFPLAAS
jgi:hypothetical protein